MNSIATHLTVPTALLFNSRQVVGSSSACESLLPRTASDPNSLADILRYSVLLLDDVVPFGGEQGQAV